MQFPSTFPLSQVVGVPLSRGDAKGLDQLGNVVEPFPVTIGSDIWIGEQVTVVGGTSIGNGCVIGLKSLVNRDCEPYGIYAGTPAKLIRKRFSEQIIEQLELLKWWEWTLPKIRANAKFFETDLTTFRGQLNELVCEHF